MTFRECLVSRLEPIWTELGHDEAIDYLGAGDVGELDNGERDPLVVEDCVAGYYYALGAAEALNVTVLELIDAHGITAADFPESE